MDSLATQSPWANGRITLGFAFDGFRFLPQKHLQDPMDRLARTAVQLITYHYSRVPEQGYKGEESQTVQLEQMGILDERFLVAHGGNPSQQDVEREKVGWGDVVGEVLGRRERVQREIEGVDMGAAKEELVDAWHLDRSALVESLEGGD